MDKSSQSGKVNFEQEVQQAQDCILPDFNSRSDSVEGERNTCSFSTGEFRQILDHIDVGILIIDLNDRRIEYRNPVFYQVLGREELCEDFQALYQLLLENENIIKNDTSGNGASGSIKLDEKLLGYSVYHTASRCCIFIRDISEIKRLESIAQAVNSIDNLGFIFSGIRHEIGNPMNSLKMTLSVLKQNLDRFSQETIDEYVDRSLADIGRVEYLLKSLRSFSMFDVVNLVEVPFGNYMDSFLSLAQMDLQKKGIRLSVETPLDLAKVRIDPRAMNQVLLNVVTNAADALEGCENAKIKISVTLREQLIWLIVSDNGCGMSPQQIKRLFHPFNSTKPSGNGLGLVITRKLLTLMGSSIDIESEVGEGTSVTISLPVSSETERSQTSSIEETL